LHLSALVAIGIVLLVCCGWYFGRHYVEKMLTQLALPCGLIWLMLFVLTYVALLTTPKRVSIPILLIFLFYWTAGSSYTGEMWANYLEGRYTHTDLENVEPFDYVIVLGGGTRSNNDGDVWLSCHGDRVILAARLYRNGKVKQLIATGAVFAWSPNPAVGSAESAAQIWREMGIPDHDIVQLTGRNTSEEMQAILKLLDQRPAQRVGLLTSGVHLPRAQRLADSHDLDVIPLAADLQTGLNPPLPLPLIPSRKGFHLSELCAKEFLAWLVGR
jgi:uncharacterized SAM-binding protein YcdF (DUF218 family)